jgi:hypothetical protein
LVWQVEQDVGAAEPDLLGEDRRIARTGAARQHRADITERGGAEFVGELLQVLVRAGQRQTVLAASDRISAKLSIALGAASGTLHGTADMLSGRVHP